MDVGRGWKKHSDSGVDDQQRCKMTKLINKVEKKGWKEKMERKEKKNAEECIKHEWFSNYSLV